MVLPLIGAAIGGIGSIASGLIGAGAQQDAMMYNYMANMYNMRQQNKWRQEAMKFAKENKAESQQGFTNANGDRVRFVSGKGWVTELSPDSARRNALQNREQENVLTNDLPKRRSALNRNYDRSVEEDDVAATLLDQFRRVRKKNPDEIYSQLIGAATQGINESYDKALGTQLRSAARTGITDTSKLTSGVNNERASALARAIAGARAQSIGMAEQGYDQQRGQLGNLYNLFASRAQQLPEVSYAPQQVDMSGLATQFANLKQGAAGQLTNAAAQSGGLVDYIEPQMGAANAIGQAGLAIAGGLKGIGADQGYGAANQQFQQYGQFPGYPYSNQGVFGGMYDDRMRSNTGIY